MEIFTNTLIQYVAELASLIVITLIGIFGTWLLSKLKEKKGLENITLATEQVLDAAGKTVLELQQTLVLGWKRAQNGKLTEDQIKELNEKVIDITISKLAEPTLNLLANAKVDISTLITSAAEAYVLQLKGGV